MQTPKGQSEIARIGEDARQRAEQEAIRVAIRAARGHVGRAAQALGIGPKRFTAYVRNAGLSIEEWESWKAEAARLDPEAA